MVDGGLIWCRAVFCGVLWYSQSMKQVKVGSHAEDGEVGSPGFGSFHCQLFIFPNVPNLPKTKRV